MTTWRNHICGEIYEGDELEINGWNGATRIAVAFFSNEYTVANALQGRVTVRFVGVNYNPDDCHSYALDLVKVVTKVVTYDPEQQGDRDDDI